jgi:hypothetical protein
MNASDLIDTLNGNITGQILADKISQEVEQYLSLLQKKGTTIPILFNEDKDVFLTNYYVQTLLNEVYKRNLSNVALAYICDCLTLGEKVLFENETLSEMIFEIADPEINGGFKSSDEIKHLLHKLR